MAIYDFQIEDVGVAPVLLIFFRDLALERDADLTIPICQGTERGFSARTTLYFI